MSKSGLFAHFGSKEELRLATVDAASAIFDDLVIEPASEEPAGVPRLRAYVERFLEHVEEGVFPGGCFFISAMGELDTHPGPVRDGAMAFSQRWLMLLAHQVAAAQAAGEFDRAADPPQIAFEPSTPTWCWATCSSSPRPIPLRSIACAEPSTPASARSPFSPRETGLSR